MIWMIILIIIAFVLLVVAGFLLTILNEKIDDPIEWGIFLAVIAFMILSVCSWRLYAKGVKRGYPTSLGNIPSDQIYKFSGQIQTSKKVVVLLENAEGRIRCVVVSEPMDPNTEYVKRATFEKEITYKIKKKRLVPVSKE